MAYPLLSNPNRHFYTTRLMGTLLFVNHITAGIDDFDGDDRSAESTARYGSGNATPASWHAVLDSDSTIPCLPDHYTAFHVKGYNSKSMGLEIGAASPDWSSKPAWWVEAVLRRAAAWWAPRVIKYDMPIRYVTSKAEVDRLIARGQKVGFTDHYVLDSARRNDPGRWRGRNTFPRQRFLQYVREAVEELNGTRVSSVHIPPLEDDDMAYFIKGTDSDRVYITNGLTKQYISSPYWLGELQKLLGTKEITTLGQFAVDRIPNQVVDIPAGIDAEDVKDAVSESIAGLEVEVQDVDSEALAADVAAKLAGRIQLDVNVTTNTQED